MKNSKVTLEKFMLALLLIAGLFGATLLLNPDPSIESAEQLSPRQETPVMMVTVD